MKVIIIFFHCCTERYASSWTCEISYGIYFYIDVLERENGRYFFFFEMK
jgi:hypothetical protein